MIYIAYWANLDGEFAAALLDSPQSAALGECIHYVECEWYVAGTDMDDPQWFQFN